MKKGSDGKSQHDKFKERIIKTLSKKRKNNLKMVKLMVNLTKYRDREIPLRQLGFEEPYPDEAFDYLATREAWGESKFAESKS